jgi:hypothetical protein
MKKSETLSESWVNSIVGILTNGIIVLPINFGGTLEVIIPALVGIELLNIFRFRCFPHAYWGVPVPLKYSFQSQLHILVKSKF